MLWVQRAGKNRSINLNKIVLLHNVCERHLPPACTTRRLLQTIPHKLLSLPAETPLNIRYGIFPGQLSWIFPNRVLRHHLGTYIWQEMAALETAAPVKAK